MSLMEERFSNNPQFSEILKRHLTTYLEKTFEGKIRDPPHSRCSTSEVKRDYEKQIDYFRENLGNSTTFVLNFEHLRSFDSQQREKDFTLSSFLLNNYFRFYRVICEAMHKFISGEIREDDLSLENVFFAFKSVDRHKTLRQLKCRDIGELVTISGTVTRCSVVEPELYSGTFLCLECGFEIPFVHQENLTFTNPKKCLNNQCSNKDKFQLLIQKSQLVNHQKIRLQERTDEIPSGMIPRSTEVIVRNDMVDLVKPGDTVKIIGTLIVIPNVAKIHRTKVKSSGAKDATGVSTSEGVFSEKKSKMNVGELQQGVSGLKVLGVGEMTYKLCFLAHFVEQTHDQTSSSITSSFFTQRSQFSPIPQKPVSLLQRLTQEELHQINKMKNDQQILPNLITSIAPTIYGYREIKEGILLQMIGGVHKKTFEGVKLRGDINVCIVGDPGVAKSQFLKYVSSVLPRAVYTSGRASSAAGLTVAVVKDGSGEFRIEAGALMLSDNGICCIDEFDKMHPNDQVAIHEAMEQQTISIAKAGIRATLHARTSILAAANPVGGRYDKSKTLRANIGYTLSPAIISRFDLFFILCDDHNDEMDERVARHIIGVHRGRNETKPKYSTKDVRLYIEYIKEVYQPIITEEAKKLLSKTFCSMRQRDKVETNAFRVTVRQLESLVRLSEAVARIYCDEKVRLRHVREAIQLLQKTITKMDISFNVDLPGVVGDDDFEADESYLREVRMGDRKQREIIYRRIQVNVERYRLDKEKEEARNEELKDQLIKIQKKIDEMYQIDREIKAGLADDDTLSKYDGSEEIQEKLKEMEEESERLESLVVEAGEKGKEVNEKYEKEKNRLSQIWESMDETLRREIEKSEDGSKRKKKRRKLSSDDDDDEEEDVMGEDGKVVRRKKKKKRGSMKRRKLQLSQEMYQKICQSFLNQIKEKYKRIKKTQKDAMDEDASLTVSELIEGSLKDRSLLDELPDIPMEDKGRLLKKILTRLITKDNVLVDVSTNKEEYEKHDIIVNPNFDGFGYDMGK